MKFPHWVIVAISCIGAALPFLVKEFPAQYSGVGLALVAIFGALKVQALGQAPAGQDGAK